VAPLAKAAHIAVTVVGSKDTGAQARKVLAVEGGIVVVAGHTSTIPGIIKALGGPAGPVIKAGLVIKKDQFSFFFVLTDPGSPRASLVVLRYGK
jgi:hypothetical protein